MLEVLSALTGAPFAVFEDEEMVDVSVKALKHLLAQQIGLPRFRLQLLHNNAFLADDNETRTLQVVQLVILEFMPADTEQHHSIIVACLQNDEGLLEHHLNQPRNPNFQGANGMTPLFAASGNGSMKCVSLLIEAGANKDQVHRNSGATPLFIAAQNGHLEVVQFLVESGAKKDQGRTDDGSTPLFIAAENGHLEVVRFLVESGANTDQCRTSDGAMPLVIALQQGHLEVVQFLVGFLPTFKRRRMA